VNPWSETLRVATFSGAPVISRRCQSAEKKLRVRPFSKKPEKGRTHGFVLGSNIGGTKSGYTSAAQKWPTRQDEIVMDARTRAAVDRKWSALKKELDID
jgi:hypothetical protein